MFVLSNVNGLVYNEKAENEDLLDFGASGNVVLRLACVIPDNENCILFYDNWFWSIDLQCELKKRIF